MGLAAIGTALGGLGSIFSGFMGAGAASKASKEQVAAQMAAIQAQEQMTQQGLAQQRGFFDTGVSFLSPFIQQGQGLYGQTAGAFSNLLSAIPGLTQPFNPTQAQLEQMPGYQFIKNQGLEAVTNANSQLGGGPLGKSLANYAEGLAGTTEQQMYNQYWGNKQNIFNMLSGVVGAGVPLSSIGASGAGTIMGAGTQAGSAALSSLFGLGQGVAGSLGNVGNAAAAGTLGSTAALQGGLSGATNAINQYGLYSQMFGGGGQPSPFSSAFGNLPATGPGAPGDFTSNMYALSQGINPWSTS